MNEGPCPQLKLSMLVLKLYINKLMDDSPQNKQIIRQKMKKEAEEEEREEMAMGH